MTNVKLYVGDNVKVLSSLPENYVQLTVTSPPYDNLRTYNGFEWRADEVIQELYRITKPGGVVVWVVSDATINGGETGSSFRQALLFMDAGFKLHDTMIYHREGPPLSHKRYEQKFEYMFVFVKGKLIKFNGLREPAKYAGDSRSSKTMRQDSDDLGRRSAKGVVQDLKLRGNVWTYNVGGNKSTRDKIAHRHPAIFPEQLALDHILSWSDPGDLVLDPFNGSGTTGKMAVSINRDYIGIDISREYIELSVERIKLNFEECQITVRMENAG